MTAVKLCGLTKERDILVANRLKPEYIGFVFWKKSRRYVEPEQAQQLKARLDRDIKAVGVFVDAPIEQVEELFSQKIIDMAQLHGNEDEMYISSLQQKGIPVIKACRVTAQGMDEEILKSKAEFILFDPGKVEGRTFGWDCIKAVKRPYFLAGGLTPENVGKAIEFLHPYAVDVSSGSETNREKDETKMAAFLQAVRKEG